MATATQDWSESDHNSLKNNPEPVITYDHMSDAETIRYFRMNQQAAGISTTHLVTELIIAGLLCATLLFFTF
jgi:hypothetical protein